MKTIIINLIKTIILNPLKTIIVTFNAQKDHTVPFEQKLDSKI